MLARSVSAWYLFACLELGDLATVRVAAGMTVIYFKLLLELGYRGQGGGGIFARGKDHTSISSSSSSRPGSCGALARHVMERRSCGRPPRFGAGTGAVESPD